MSSPEFLNAMNDLRLTNQFCDVKLKLSNNREFLLHRNVISSCSRYFMILFTSKIGKENTRTGQIIETYLPLMNISDEVVNEVITYMYTKKMTITEYNVYDLYILSDYLLIEKAVNMCKRFLVNNLGPENCVEVYDFGCMQSYNPLIEEAQNFVTNNFSAVAKLNTDILDKPLNYILPLIRTQNLDVTDEEDVWKFVVKWVQHQNYRQYYLSQLLREIKFGLMKKDFFISEIEVHPLIKENSYTRPIVKKVKKFFEDLENLESLEVEYCSPQFAVPRYPKDMLLAIGGWSTGTALKIIESYDYKCDRWVDLDICDYEGRNRAYHGSVFLNRKLYLIGGYDESREYFSTCRCYDFEKNTWSHIASMYFRRCFVSVALLNGCIYAMGGHTGANRLVTVERYNPATNQWKIVCPMHLPRSDADATVLNGKIYITGGFNGLDVLDSVEMYDPELNTWTILPPMHSRRSGVSCVALNNFLYVFGGFDGDNRLRTCEKYDPIKNRWTELPDMNLPRSNFAAEIINNEIIIFGGFDGSTTINHTEFYDPVSNQWKIGTDMNYHRSGLSGCVISNLPFNENLVYPRNKDLLEEKRYALQHLDAGNIS